MRAIARLLAAHIGVVSLHAEALAQDLMPVPKTPPHHSEVQAPRTGPAAAFLARDVGIPLQEAQERIALQSEISVLVEQV